MTKKEIYAWASFGFAGAILCYYLITITGWADAMPEMAQGLKNILWKVILVALVVEFILDGLRSLQSRAIHEDERDKLIEAKGFRNGYCFIIGAIVLLLGHLVIQEGIIEMGLQSAFAIIPYFSIHFLVVSLFAAMMIKSATQLYYYHKF